MLDTWVTVLFAVVGGFALLFAAWKASGIVVVHDDAVAVVKKKFAARTMKVGQLIALDGEAGVQARTLMPGWHFFYWPWQYGIERTKLVTINPGQLGTVIARDGSPSQGGSIVSATPQCNNFQDAEAFIKGGGCRGKQLAVLRAGTYRINPELFQVEVVQVLKIQPGKVGIVTTADGNPLDAGDIAGPRVEGHNNFQDPAAFLAKGGRRGLQEQVLTAGDWNINPWFATVEVVPMTEIEVGHVGVVTSYVGAAPVDQTGEGFKHGNLVEVGQRGVWEKPLHPGLHPINTRTQKVESIPTTNVVLNWAEDKNEAHKLDANLCSIAVRSKDGFTYNLDVSVIIHVPAERASRVVSRMGGVQKLIANMMEPTISNYFRNAAQEYSALDFLAKRSELQGKAAAAIKAALAEYDVQAVDTVIGDVSLPADLLKTQTERKLAQEMESTYQAQQAAQKQAEALERQKAVVANQPKVVEAEQAVKIAEMLANQAVKKAEGETKAAEQTALKTRKLAEADAFAIQAKAEAEAKGIEAKGKAQAAAYKGATEALGADNFARMETFQRIGDGHIKITPDVIAGGGDGGAGIINVLLGTMVAKEINGKLHSKDDKGVARNEGPA